MNKAGKNKISKKYFEESEKLRKLRKVDILKCHASKQKHTQLEKAWKFKH